MENKYNFLKPLVFACSLGLAACGGSGSDDPIPNDPDPDPTAQTGVFLDSPVINIGYRTETQSGVTNALGEYNYLPGETVTFFIGDLEFPSAPATGVVTPLELAGTTDTSNPTVVNIIRLLQTLDQDGNPDNGITITETAISTATQVDFDATSVNFSLSVDAFAALPAVDTLITDAGLETSVSALVDTTEAIAHFEDELGEFTTLIGTWRDPAEPFFLLSFFADGSYLHSQINDNDGVSGMEWGTWSREQSTGKMTVTQSFETNGDAGLSPFVGSPESLLINAEGNTLTVSFDDNGTGVLEISTLQRATSSGLIGTWKQEGAANLVFSFFENGTYMHSQTTSDGRAGEVGMEWGTWSRDEETGKITFSPTFDNNGDIGMNDFNGTSGKSIFFNVTGDVLTITGDETGNGIIDFTLDLQRNVLTSNTESPPLAFTAEELTGSTFYYVWFSSGGADDPDCPVGSYEISSESFDGTSVTYSGCDGTETGTYTIEENGDLNYGNTDWGRRVSYDDVIGAYIYCVTDNPDAIGTCTISSTNPTGEGVFMFTSQSAAEAFQTQLTGG